MLAVNDNYLLAPFADILYACDDKWWQWHWNKPELQAFAGQKVTQDKKAADRYGIEYIESSGRCGLSEDPAIIHQGSNSGYQAINLAYHTGARQIILIGYDMQTTGGKAHWFGHHPDKVVSGHKGWLLLYASLADHARKVGLEIINCTIETALTCFERQNLVDTLKNIAR